MLCARSGSEPAACQQNTKGPAGVLSIETGIGDDHFRYAVTNFVPSFQHKKGWAFDKVDPRFTVSGPIVKGKLWFFDGLDGEYDNVVNPELPTGADSDRIWRGGNLAKVQANVTNHDIITGGFLLDWQHDEHQGFSFLAPPDTRPADNENVYVASVKEQHTFSSDTLFEIGYAFDHYGTRVSPAGSLPFALTPAARPRKLLSARKYCRTAFAGVVKLLCPAAEVWASRSDFWDRSGIHLL